jgi:Bacterial protein of unknown function (DUF885)
MSAGNRLHLTLAVLLFAPAAALPQGPPAAPKEPVAPKKDAPDVRKDGEAKAKDVNDPVPPDVVALIAQPSSESRALARHYDADRGALRRKYTVPTASEQYARLRRFHTGWLSAVDNVDQSALTDTGRQDLAGLRKRIDADIQELDAAYQRHAEIAPLVPFGPAIVALEDARKRVDPIDPVKLARGLTDLKRQIDATREAVAADLAKGDTASGVFVTKSRAERLAEAIKNLRDLLRWWHGFYAGYDPLYTWWASQPYKEADTALDKYAQFIAQKANDRPAADPSKSTRLPQPRIVSADPPELPDLKSLMARPSEMAGVIQRYQADFGNRGRGPGSNEPAADRQARIRKLAEGWQSALAKLDFDKLRSAAQVDYLLLKYALAREAQRSEQPAAGGPRSRRKDDNEIVGRPIGREAILAALASEMIPYTPEQLVELADREYAWCEAEMKKAAREMGFGEDWKKAVEQVKSLHVPPGGQPKLIRDLAFEAIDYLRANDLVTVPPLAAETWRMEMMTPERQRFNPFFTGGEVIVVSFPTDAMSHEAKLQSLRGNNVHFSRATVHHELIPGHHLQQFMNARYQPQRSAFGTPFWTEGWAVYWEMVLYQREFPKSPEDRVGLMFWRMHRCARVTFSLGFHLGKMNPQQCIDLLVDKVGHERENATAEVRRSFAGAYPPLYQAGYLVGAKQFWALRHELVDSGRMTEKAFHDASLKENHMPVELVRAVLTNQKLTRDFVSTWKFAGDLPAAGWPSR